MGLAKIRNKQKKKSEKIEIFLKINQDGKQSPRCSKFEPNFRCSGTFRSYLVSLWRGFGSRRYWSSKRMKTVNYHKTGWKVKHTLFFISRTGTRHGTRITLNWAIASRTQSWCGLHASTCGSSLHSTAFICTATAEVGCPSLHSAMPSWWDRPLRPVNVIQACQVSKVPAL